MKSFRIKYSKLVWTLISLVIILSLGGLIWNVFNIVNFFKLEFSFKTVLYIIIAVFTLFLLILSVSMLFHGIYAVKDDKIKLWFGIIPATYDITKIVRITVFKKTQKLVCYFEDGKYTVIVISPDYYDDFISQLKNSNSNIVYDENSEEENEN